MHEPRRRRWPASSAAWARIIAAGVPLVPPVRLQGPLERPRQPRPVDDAPLRRVPRRSRREGLVGREPARRRISDVEPRVLFEAGGNMLRRQRGGQTLLLEHLWPKLKMIVSVDTRINTTGLYSDYILPAAQHYEKLQHEHAVGAPSELRARRPRRRRQPARRCRTTRSACACSRRSSGGPRRAASREFTDRAATTRRLTGLVAARHARTARCATRRRASTRRCATTPSTACCRRAPPSTTLREKGAVRFTGWGMVGHGISQASTLAPDEVHNPLRWHTEDKVPYATLTRRAQFYIDHEWFLEAGEALPVHKESPGHGGPRRRFQMTSGHNRWSIHSMNMTERDLAEHAPRRAVRVPQRPRRARPRHRRTASRCGWSAMSATCASRPRSPRRVGPAR